MRDNEDRRARFEATTLPLMTALYNVATRLTGSAEDAADVVQDTYLRAYRTFDNFRPGTNARAWLFTILYSVAINRQQRTRRDANNVSFDDVEERFQQYLEADESDESEFGRFELNSPEIDTALRDLPEAFRTAILLVDVQELSYEDAAAVAGCPVGTLRSRLFRGRRLLFTALHDYARRTGYLKTGDG